MRNTFRLTYMMQFTTALCIAASLFLPWDDELQTGAELLLIPMEEFSFPVGFFHPLWTLWILPLTVCIVILRTSYNYVDHRYPIWINTNRWLVLGGIMVMGWLLALSEASDASPANGFWACLSSLAILLILTGLEGIMPTRLPSRGQETWRFGDKIFRPCPFCGRYNDIDARICWNCGMVQIPNERT